MTEEEIDEANRAAQARSESGLMIDALLDQDTHVLLEELRRRMQGEEPA